ncbi:hypothetical protein CVT26_002440, partial [Gymnopilus dilepis]
MAQAAIFVFDALEGFGLSVLSIVFLTACVSRQVKRTPTWYTFIAAGILSSVVQLLLLRQQLGPPPNQTICFIQGTLIYPMTALNALICAALIFQVFISMKLTQKSKTLSGGHIFWINAIPISVSIALLVYAIVTGTLDKTRIERDASGIRCHITPPQVSDVTAGVSVAAGVLILGTEVAVLVNIFRNRRAFRDILSRSNISLSFVVRLCAFNLVVLVVMLCTVWRPSELDQAGRFDLGNISQAVLPVAEGLIFGTQK